MSKPEKSDSWERTGVNGLLRHPQNRRYYWLTRIDGKQKWEALKTDDFAVAKRHPRLPLKHHAEILDVRETGVLRDLVKRQLRLPKQRPHLHDLLVVRLQPL